MGIGPWEGTLLRAREGLPCHTSTHQIPTPLPCPTWPLSHTGESVTPWPIYQRKYPELRPLLLYTDLAEMLSLAPTEAHFQDPMG